MNSVIRQSPRRFPRSLAAAVVAVALGLMQCETRLAGSSVGTGNPTEIEVAFADEAGPVALKGRMEVFAATQIPVPGFGSRPLLQVDLDGDSRAILDAETFRTLGDSIWPESSLEGDSAWQFNVVVTCDSQGAVIQGLRFARLTGEFLLRPEDAPPKEGKAAEVACAIRALVETRGRMDAGALNPESENFLFVYGTGFFAKGDSGRFVFPRMPEGEYEAFLISYDTGNFPSGSGLLDVFGLDASIRSGNDSFVNLTDVRERVPIPDSLKAK